VQPGGGMAGKSIQESKAARLLDQGKSPTVSITPSPRTSKDGMLTLNIKDKQGRALIAYLDPKDLQVDTPTAEFAGLASTPVPTHSRLEEVEWAGWIALEEEPQTKVDWNEYSRPVEESTYATIAPLQQTKRTAISLDTHPFYVDSGATIHISPDQSDFQTLRAIPARSVKGVGGSSIVALGMGDIRLRVARGAYIILKDTLYIPHSTVRLISVSALSITCGTAACFDDECVKIINKSTGAFIAGGPLIPSKRLYSLTLHSAYAEHILSAQHSPDIETWHRRLGHANFQAITEMARKGMIAGMPSSFSSKPPKCESCILGKQTKTPVPKKREEGPGHRSQRKLGIIWVDLTGPEDVTARSGHSYIMNLVDDYTSMVWTILLKRKSDALPELKAWELARESETGLKVGIYRTGNDGELKSDAMRDWLKSRGVQQEFGAPYTSEHIGRVERMHRTLMGKARSMRIAARCPPNMWGEFYLTATHLHAKTLTSSLNGTTPWELYYGQKPDYSYMREIGCRAFVLILNKHNPKIYERSIECILIGYDPKAKTYRCYDRRSGNIYSSYHVRFLESHDGHPPHPIDLPKDAEPSHPPSLQEIIDTAIIKPLAMDDEQPQIPLPQDDDEPPPEPAPAAPLLNEPRRSSRIPIPTVKSNPNNPPQTRTEKAVQESKESAERVKAARDERRQMIQDLHNEPEPDPALADQAAIAELRELFKGLDLGDIGENIDHDRIFSAISEAGSIDPSLLEFEDEPKTWNEAKESADAKQ
jgi:hypothetical protein